MKKLLKSNICLFAALFFTLIFTCCKEEIHIIPVTIDNSLQSKAEEALKSHILLPDSTLSGAAAVIMDIEKGAVLALAGIGCDASGAIFSNNQLAYRKQFEPGSLLHLATLNSLFEDGYVALDSKIDAGDGRWVANGHTYTDIHPVGEVTVKEAFDKSSNIAFAKLVQEYYSDNPQRFTDNLKGYFSVEYSDSSCNVDAILADPSDIGNWHKSNLTSMSIGYQIMVTPLQIATLYNNIAKDGSIILSEDFTTKNGTSHIMFDSDNGYEMNGKRKYQTSICGFFPADNPKYTLLVTIFSTPTEGIFLGSPVAMAIYKDIAF